MDVPVVYEGGRLAERGGVVDACSEGGPGYELRIVEARRLSRGCLPSQVGHQRGGEPNSRHWTCSIAVNFEAYYARFEPNYTRCLWYLESLGPACLLEVY